MQTFVKKNKFTLGVLFTSFFLYFVISFFSKPLIEPEGAALKKIIVPVQGKDVKKFDMKTTAKALNNASKTIEYSLAFPSSVIRETKYDGRTTNFYYDGSRVASLTFVYNDKKAYTSSSYTESVLGKRIPIAIDSKELPFGSYSYITASAEKSYFRIASVKEGEWLVSLEVLEGNQEFEKMILDSLSLK